MFFESVKGKLCSDRERKIIKSILLHMVARGSVNFAARLAKKLIYEAREPTN